MNMKKIIALSAVAVAAVAGASTNYVELAEKRRNLVVTVNEMSRDPALANPTAFRAALEDLDRGMVTSKVAIAPWALSRRCPLAARAMLGRETGLSKKVCDEMIARCDYDAENILPAPKRDEPGYVNSRLQAACLGGAPVASVRNEVLNAAIVPVRRHIRATGGTFVDKEGAEKVKAILDKLAKELNAPRFGKADEILATLGIEVEGDYIRSKMPTEDSVAALRKCLMDGEIPFTYDLQNKLCIVLGVDAYNAFVKEYNGK